MNQRWQGVKVRLDPHTCSWVCLGCCEAAWRGSLLLAGLLFAPRLLLLLALLPGVLQQQLLLQPSFVTLTCC
jgi:hypothetical protein